MTRAQMRRERKKKKRKQATYTLTQEQVDNLVKAKLKEALADDDYIREVSDDVYSDVLNTSITLFLYFPLKVFVDKYWEKFDNDPQVLSDFVNDILGCYEDWQDGKFTEEDMKEELWQKAGVRLEEGK